MLPSTLFPPNVQVAIPTLLQRQVTVHKNGTTERVSLMPLAMLLLESAQRYLADPPGFGKQAKTLDEALRPALEKWIFATSGRLLGYVWRAHNIGITKVDRRPK